MKAKRKKRSGAGRGPGDRGPLKANLAWLNRLDPALAAAARQPPAPGQIEWHVGSPEAEIAQLQANAELGGASVLVLVGLGLGHELIALAGGGGIRHVFVIEPDIELLRRAMRTVALAKLPSSTELHFLVGQPPPLVAARVAEIWQERNLLRFAEVIATVIPAGARRRYGAVCDELAGAAQAGAQRAVRTVGNSVTDALCGLEHTLRNLPQAMASPGSAPLHGLLAGHLAVVASAGPSLGKQLPLLREVQDRVVIICPDTSVRPLLAAGVRPHMVASRERVPFSVLHFKDADVGGAWLAAPPLVHPASLAAYHGPTLILPRTSGHTRWFWPESEALQFGGSSGNMAFRLAELMGCDPVLLIGQDLAYGAGGHTHVADASFGDQQEVYQAAGTFMVPGNLGRPVRTNEFWHLFRLQYERDVAASEVRVINCTEGGAFIRGAQVAPFRQSLDKHLPRARTGDVVEALQALGRPPDGYDAPTEARRLRDLLDASRDRMKELAAWCDDGVQAVRRAQELPPAQALVGLPPDLVTLLDHEPLRSLERRRRSLVDQAGFDLLAPTTRAFLLEREVALYALQRRCVDGAALLVEALPLFASWFQGVEQLAARTSELLAWGDDSLHRAFPELPPPGPLPERTLLDEVVASDTWLQADWHRLDGVKLR